MHVPRSPFVFTCLVAACAAGIIEVQDCPGVDNKVTDVTVDVSECPAGNNCTLYRGNTYYLKTTFTPDANYTAVRMRTLGVLGVLKLPYRSHVPVCPEATTEDGENCDTGIGLQAAKAYTHVRDFPVRRLYPEISMRARVEYFNGTRPSRRNLILCYEVPVKIGTVPENDINVDEN